MPMPVRNARGLLGDTRILSAHFPLGYTRAYEDVFMAHEHWRVVSKLLGVKFGVACKLVHRKSLCRGFHLLLSCCPVSAHLRPSSLRSGASEQPLPRGCVSCCLQACFVLEHSDETMSQWSHPFRWVERRSGEWCLVSHLDRS